jgi:hypothetical protein
VVGSGDADSMLQFWLERGSDSMKLCQKMKRSQRARLGSMGRKCDMTRWPGNDGWRREDTGEGKGMR